MKRNTGPNALRRGRASHAGASYFLTLCVEDRRPVLHGALADAVQAALREPEDGHIWRLRCGTVMPDHIHCLIELGSVRSLSRSLGRFKSLTKDVLATAAATWQENFYDHLLRPWESIEPVMQYIYLNPYQAGLIKLGEEWSRFYCCAEDWAWFSELTDSGQPFPEWLL